MTARARRSPVVTRRRTRPSSSSARCTPDRDQVVSGGGLDAPRQHDRARPRGRPRWIELDAVEHQARLPARGGPHDQGLALLDADAGGDPGAALAPRVDEEIERDAVGLGVRRGHGAPRDLERPPGVARLGVGEGAAGGLRAVFRVEPAAGVAEGAQDGEVGEDAELLVGGDPGGRALVGGQGAREESGLAAHLGVHRLGEGEALEEAAHVPVAGAVGELEELTAMAATACRSAAGPLAASARAVAWLAMGSGVAAVQRVGDALCAPAAACPSQDDAHASGPASEASVDSAPRTANARGEERIEARTLRQRLSGGDPNGTR